MARRLSGGTRASQGVRFALALAAVLLLEGCRGHLGQDVQRAGYRRGVYHTVRRGNTLWSISRAYRVDIEQVAVLNGIPDPNRLEVGQRIFIPGAAGKRKAAAARSAPPPRRRPKWAVSPQDAPGARSKPRQSRRGQRVKFSWPVRGKILTRFGTRRGTKYDGIDILATPNATVKASASGEVIFSDWGPGGYGRTIIIRHAGGEYHSVYAHNARNLVRKGDAVRRGAAIARVGATGRTEAAKLHFEIRHRTKPRNPLSFLP